MTAIINLGAEKAALDGTEMAPIQEAVGGTGTEKHTLTRNFILPGVTRGWRSIAVGAVGGAAGAGAAPTWEAWQGALYAYSFSPDVINELILPALVVPHDYQAGTNVFPWVSWAPSNTLTNAVRWGLEYSVAMGHNQETFAAPATTSIEQTAPGVLNQHMTAVASAGILSTALEPGAVIVPRLFRDAAHANDTYASKAWAFAAGLLYQSDREASDNMSPPWNGA